MRLFAQMKQIVEGKSYADRLKHPARPPEQLDRLFNWQGDPSRSDDENYINYNKWQNKNRPLQASALENPNINAQTWLENYWRHPNKKKVFQNPSIPLWHLENPDFGSDNSQYITDMYSHAPHLKDLALGLIHKNTEAQQKLFSDRNVAPEVKQKLIQHIIMDPESDMSMYKKSLSHPLAPMELLQHRLENPRSNIDHEYIIDNPNTTSDMIHKILGSPTLTHETGLRAAINPKTSPEDLHALSKMYNNSAAIGQFVTRHPNVSKETLGQLSMLHRYGMIKDQAASRLYKEDPVFYRNFRDNFKYPKGWGQRETLF